MDWPISFGGNVELAYMRQAAEEQPFTLEIRPIAEAHLGPVVAIANVPLEKPFSGPGTHDGVTIAPQGEVMYRELLPWLSPAVEYYSDLGRRRGTQAVRNSGKKGITHAEAYQRVFPQVTDALA